MTTEEEKTSLLLSLLYAIQCMGLVMLWQWYTASPVGIGHNGHTEIPLYPLLHQPAQVFNITRFLLVSLVFHRCSKILQVVSSKVYRHLNSEEEEKSTFQSTKSFMGVRPLYLCVLDRRFIIEVYGFRQTFVYFEFPKFLFTNPHQTVLASQFAQVTGPSPDHTFTSSKHEVG